MLSKFDRFKGAGWFEYVLNKPVIVVGAGGIGSWTSFLLSRLGCEIYIYDDDNFEPYNQGGQLVANDDMGKNKANVAVRIAMDFAQHDKIYSMGRYEEDSETAPIMFSCLDNMKTRKMMFEKWVSSLTDENKDESFFVDGRLNADQYQILCVHGNSEKEIEEYKKSLFKDSDVENGPCTFKQTSHAAMGIASHMIGFFTNFAQNRVLGKRVYGIPFFYEYLIPMNHTTIKNVQTTISESGVSI